MCVCVYTFLGHAPQGVNNPRCLAWAAITVTPPLRAASASVSGTSFAPERKVARARTPPGKVCVFLQSDEILTPWRRRRVSDLSRKEAWIKCLSKKPSRLTSKQSKGREWCLLVLNSITYAQRKISSVSGMSVGHAPPLDTGHSPTSSFASDPPPLSSRVTRKRRSGD